MEVSTHAKCLCRFLKINAVSLCSRWCNCWLMSQLSTTEHVQITLLPPTNPPVPCLGVFSRWYSRVQNISPRICMNMNVNDFPHWRISAVNIIASTYQREYHPLLWEIIHIHANSQGCFSYSWVSQWKYPSMELGGKLISNSNMPLLFVCSVFSIPFLALQDIFWPCRYIRVVLNLINVISS